MRLELYWRAPYYGWRKWTWGGSPSIKTGPSVRRSGVFSGVWNRPQVNVLIGSRDTLMQSASGEFSPPTVSSGNFRSLRSLTVSCFDFQGSSSPPADCMKVFGKLLVRSNSKLLIRSKDPLLQSVWRLTGERPPFSFIWKLPFPPVSHRFLLQPPGFLFYSKSPLIVRKDWGKLLLRSMVALL